MIKIGYVKILAIALVSIFSNALVSGDYSMLANAAQQNNATDQINPLSPFGIKLGEPFPANIAHKLGVSYDKTQLQYNEVHVPKPHSYFNISNKGYFNPWPYKVILSTLTKEVLRVEAVSSLNTGDRTNKHCEKIHTIYNQIKNDSGFIESAKIGNYPAGWYQIGESGNTWRGNLYDGVVESEYGAGHTIREFVVNVDCSSGSRNHAIFKFVDLEAFKRNSSR